MVLKSDNLFKHQQFEAVLSDKEKAAWKSLEKVSNGFVGNFKTPNFRELVQDLVDSYEQLGCNMSLKCTGFLSIKLWRRERRTRGSLSSRHFGVGAQVQREMELCHVR